jgi:beta-phosphoglucomutase-like phosphatase (HAD superfamily)
MLVLEDSENGTKSAAAAGAVAVSIPHEHSRTHDFTSATLIAERLDDPQILRLLPQ